MTTSSTPFLTLARHFKVDYGDVLMCADGMETATPTKLQIAATERLNAQCRHHIKRLIEWPVYRRHDVHLTFLPPQWCQEGDTA